MDADSAVWDRGRSICARPKKRKIRAALYKTIAAGKYNMFVT